MDMILTEPEIRVLASLVEKAITTPEYYPLTLNALINACNQKSNRDPVVTYDECIVTQAAQDLSDKGLVVVGAGRNDRVVKYEEYFAHEFRLSSPEVAVLCELMLRGPQTIGELRARCERLHKFESTADVEVVLDGLAVREDGAFVIKLPRQMGYKECRYAHRLAGEVNVEQGDIATPHASTCSENERISRLEAELEDLRQQFMEFKRQFE